MYGNTFSLNRRQNRQSHWVFFYDFPSCFDDLSPMEEAYYGIILTITSVSLSTVYLGRFFHCSLSLVLGSLRDGSISVNSKTSESLGIDTHSPEDLVHAPLRFTCLLSTRGRKEHCHYTSSQPWHETFFLSFSPLLIYKTLSKEQDLYMWPL